MIKDSVNFMKKCSKCQQHAHFHIAPAEGLSTIMSLWPFSKWGIDLLGPFLLALGQVKYVIMATDYFTKWIEAEPLSTIVVAQVMKFIWRNIFTHFEMPESMVTDNGIQFMEQKFWDFLTSYKVKHRFSSVEHPQANGQVEVANKVIFRGLKKRLDKRKGAWADELRSVLWSYQTTPQLTTGETPFKLNYGVDAMILVEVEEPNLMVIF